MRPAIGADLSAGFKIQLDTLSRGYDGKTCWVHPRAGIIPDGKTSIIVTTQKLLVTGSDVFYAINDFRSDDLGKSWTGPTEHSDTLGRRDEPDGVIVAICDAWPKWHAKSGKLLCIGQTVRYRDNKCIENCPRETAYSVYDPQARSWTAWSMLAMPDSNKFRSAAAGSAQRVDLANGDILLPIYLNQDETKKNYAATVVRCRFDGQKLTYVEQGSEHSVDVDRGLYEPSLAVFKGRYFLTLRNDRAGYVTAGNDGLHFEPARKWLWDNGEDLGNYNTQQHWVTHSDALYLVYTRKGANNDHVFRHRAPLFIAQVDPDKLRVIRSTERVLIPERGARLCNFGVAEVNENETWVTVSEWMQTWGPNYVMPKDNKYGADNSIYAARILWDKPNRDWNRQ